MSYVKDPNTGAVLNTDTAALNKYKMERSYYRRVDALHNDIIEIKKSLISINEKIEKLESKENG